MAAIRKSPPSISKQLFGCYLVAKMGLILRNAIER